jgi:hypothetical protein
MQRLTTISALLFCFVLNAAETKTLNLTFCCDPQNDLFVALQHYKCPRYSTPSEAIANAPERTGVMILADRYPERSTEVDPSDFDKAKKKHLRVYIEFPASLPGMEVSLPRQATWERVVVSSGNFAPALPKMRILGISDAHFMAVLHPPAADLVIARVAGFDTALYGLPEKAAYPLLFSLPEKGLVVATTKLSSFISARFEPAADWRAVWHTILSWLDPEHTATLEYVSVVIPAARPNEKLPRSFQLESFNMAANWFSHSHLLISPAQQSEFALALKVGVENTMPPDPKDPEGDGTLGMMEGYSSGIRWDGQQLRRLPIRADCNAETAMVLALDGSINKNKESAKIANNLLDYVYFNSDMCQGLRADPKHPAFGLIGWGSIAPAWLVANYGDDNARTMLSTMVAAAVTKTDRWDAPLLRGLLANLRTTGKLGFRGDRVDVPALEQNGWEHFHNAATISYSPHFEAFLWACNLWAFRETHYAPFLERTTNAIAMTMNVYPGEWRWQNNLERAHMLLCLAWLVQLDKTAHISSAQDATLHRHWLDNLTDDLLADQQANGAIRESLGRTQGHYQKPTRNEDYGTTETPLIQENGDPVTDQLYTTGFALLGLHEAAAATHEAKLKHAEDKLADFLCRIQTRSKKIDYCNGTWFRAFDDKRWDFWASSADVGWGAWSLEAGWGQAWTTAILGLREKRTTVWELTQRTRIAKHLDAMLRQMQLPE